MRIAVYLRVSTTDQNPALQLQEILAYLKANSTPDDQVEIFEDKSTGKNLSRVEFKRMITAVQARKFDRIVCWKIDRFSRSLRDFLNIWEELKDANAEFIAVSQKGLDLSTPEGKAFLQMMGVMAELESGLIGERTKAGMAAAKARGAKFGRPKTRDDLTILKLHRTDPSLTSRQIARIVGVDQSTVSRSLQFSKRQQIK